MKILIKHATLVSMDENREKIEENMDILIQQDRIEKIGKNIMEKDCKILEANHRIVMPGMINTHAHVPMSLFKESVDGYPLQEWLEKKIWPIEDHLTNEDIQKYSAMTFDEMIHTGTTMVNDQYFDTEAIIRAAQEKQIRIELTRTLMDSDGKGDRRLDELEELLEKYKQIDGCITFNIGLHGLYTPNETYVQKVTDFARKTGLKIHMHFCENAKEVEDIKREYHVDYPAQVLKKYFYGIPVILAHGVKLTEQDIQILKTLNVSVAHCPVSNLKLGCGIAPVQMLLKKGLNVSLGTDGQGSGSNMDMFEAMKFAALLQKGSTENPMAMGAYETLQLATINGAKAMGMEKEIGSITVGKKADLILVDLEENYVERPVNDVLATLVYNAKGTNVKMTMVNGKILMNEIN